MRCTVVQACRQAQGKKIPVIQVVRRLPFSERTVRRWRQSHAPVKLVRRRGRPPRPATLAERNAATDFLSQGGGGVPLSALRRAFPQIPRADLRDVQQRYRRLERRRLHRKQSRLEWRVPGTVWAVDFKEPREPLEGRYGWILSIKDLASRCQLSWLPLEQATAAVVYAEYQRLFAEHGPPLVLKSDNGGQFRDENVKALLAAHQVLPLYNPKRRPSYNGGVERANGQLAGYQAAQARRWGRADRPTRNDAEQARRLANSLARPLGWSGPAAVELWEARPLISPMLREALSETVNARRAVVRAAWDFDPHEKLSHYPQAAVDRRAVRDALLAHDLLRIHPRRRRSRSLDPNTTVPGTEKTTPENDPEVTLPVQSAVTIMLSQAASPMVGEAQSEPSGSKDDAPPEPEKVHSSANSSHASGHL
jgi:transposase InsO family protein